MLTVEQCRMILGPDAPESPDEIEKLRDQLYVLAKVWIEQGAVQAVNRADHILCEMGNDERYEIEERAAVLEFDGGMDKADAEKAAIAAHLRRSRE